MQLTLPLVSRETCLRRFLPEDAARFHAYRSDAELARYQSWSAMSLEEAGQFVAEMTGVQSLVAGDWIQLAIADSGTNELLGDLGLYLEPDGSAAEVGFTLARDAQGQGHAGRAVRLALSLVLAASAAPVVRAVTDQRNVKSIRVLERAGFARSAERQVVFKGESCTELVLVVGLAERVPA